MSDSETVAVGRIGRAHGIKGEVSVEPRTDEPERRFAAGSVLHTRAPGGVASASAVPRALTVSSTRWHSGRLLVRFAELADRTAAEAARGLWLEVDLDPDEQTGDPDEFYDHQLTGLRVEDEHGQALGVVAQVVHGPGQDLLAITRPDGTEALVPFVQALVPVVDLPGGRIVVDDRPGLIGGEAETSGDGR